ncbi:LicD family protein [Mesobacillus sp. S13]|uniref:LicD family protein n=1 Tax=Mesobacillus sp. S13 TaxID=2880221 RepID=UPI001CF0EA2A|nr:LicD family protein [Mesobacillus sp. S13]
MEKEIDQQNPLLAAQSVMTDMLYVIHQICEKHDIKYWLTDGSLLGSIRHKGFIPWDDDADIGMMREDYNKFLRIIQEELPSPYKVQSKVNQTHGLHNWLKIMYMEDFEWVDWWGNWTKGLSIDVFPFDFVPEKYENKKSLKEKLINRVATIRYPLSGNPLKTTIQRTINKVKIHNIYSKYNKQTNIVTYGIELPYYGWAYFHVDEIFPLKKGQFGKHEFYIPNNYERYLEKLYGNYMELPKPEDRVSHMANLKFSRPQPPDNKPQK